ncbi:MAG TPA: hypothetical protein VMT15_14145 [Bryobacteraceae bacterium]|nr:hypothetical protein [Bryobacteraceae bacterium]
MYKLAQVGAALALGIAWNSIASAQETPQYNSVNCVKVRDGKGAEYTAFLRDVGMKLSKARVDSGRAASVIYAQAAYPAGRQARCDYNIVTTNGFPPEPPTAAQTDADMKTAGITMGRQEMVAKRNDLSYLVGSEIWRGRAIVGGFPKQGGYVRLNYFKTKPNMGPEWLNLETTGWKQLAENVAKDMPGTSWSLWTLTMPGGASLPYDGLTVDGFPSWEALGKGIPVRATWNKVHPEMDYAQFTDRVANTVDRPRIDVMRIVDVITK